MNNPNPFVPQGSLLEQKNKKRARFKVAVISIFAVNIVFVSGLLIQGCKKEAPADNSTLPSPDTTTNTPDTNLPPVPDTNAPVATYSNTPPPAPVYTPPPAPPAPVVETPATQEYVVAKGDSFYSIGKKFHVKIKEIEAANPGVTPAKLKVGQKLQVPGASSGSSSTTSGAPMSADSGSDNIVTVKPGDTLAKLAKEHGSTIKLIRSANDLKTDKIKVGQKLKVPAKAAPADTSVAPTSAPAPVSAPTPSVPAVSPPMPPPSVPANGAAR